MSGSPTFIEKHGLWSDEQKRLAAALNKWLVVDMKNDWKRIFALE
jgi:hypothetical protein